MDFNIIGKIFEKFKLTFNWSRKNSPVLSTKQTIEGNNNIGNIQTRDVHIHHGLSVNETTHLINSIVDQKLISYKDEAAQIYKINQNKFKNILYKQIQDLNEEELYQFKDPDTQLSLLEAASISGRKSNEELIVLLSDLVIKRIKDEKKGDIELRKIVYNEAIKTINKITINQLKIITLCYLIKYTTNDGISSFDTFIQYIFSKVLPLVPLKKSFSEFQHIEYAGCGSIELVNSDLSDLFRNQYSFLFLNSFKRNQIESFNLSDSLLNTIIYCNGDNCFFKIKNRTVLKKLLDDSNDNNDINDQLIAFYDKHTKDKKMIQEEIETKIPASKSLFEYWKNSSIGRLSLTTVGIALAISYYEKKIGEKVDINIWID